MLLFRKNCAAPKNHAQSVPRRCRLPFRSNQADGFEHDGGELANSGFCLPRELWTHRCARIDATIVALRKLTGFAGGVPTPDSATRQKPSFV
jgi:hypothetical protein